MLLTASNPRLAAGTAFLYLHFVPGLSTVFPPRAASIFISAHFQVVFSMLTY